MKKFINKQENSEPIEVSDLNKTDCENSFNTDEYDLNTLEKNKVQELTNNDTTISIIDSKDEYDSVRDAFEKTKCSNSNVEITTSALKKVPVQSKKSLAAIIKSSKFKILINHLFYFFILII